MRRGCQPPKKAKRQRRIQVSSGRTSVTIHFVNYVTGDRRWQKMPRIARRSRQRKWSTPGPPLIMSTWGRFIPPILKPMCCGPSRKEGGGCAMMPKGTCVRWKEESSIPGRGLCSLRPAITSANKPSSSRKLTGPAPGWAKIASMLLEEEPIGQFTRVIHGQSLRTSSGGKRPGLCY